MSGSSAAVYMESHSLTREIHLAITAKQKEIPIASRICGKVKMGQNPVSTQPLFIETWQNQP